MAITNYTTLKTAIGTWMYGRTDLDDYLDDFISNAENRFNFGVPRDTPFPSDPIRTRDMINSTDLTLTDGEVALPDGFLEPKRVTAKTSPRRKLEYVSPDWIDEAYPNTESGDPWFYTILGSNLVVRPTTTSSIELKYYKKITGLSSSNATNWLITASPNVYLYACLMEACIFITNRERAVEMYGLMTGAIGGVMMTDKRSKATIPARRANGQTP